MQPLCCDRTGEPTVLPDCPPLGALLSVGAVGPHPALQAGLESPSPILLPIGLLPVYECSSLV